MNTMEINEQDALLQEGVPRNRSRRGVKAAGVVAASLAAAGAIYLWSGSAGAANTDATTAHLTDLQGKDEVAAAADRPKLAMDGDMGEFVTAIPDSVSRGVGASGPKPIVQAAKLLFRHAMETSGAVKELKKGEYSAWMDRFVDHMKKASGEEKFWKDSMLSVAKKIIESQKPVVTEARVSSWNSEGNSYKLGMRDWMVDVSVDSFNDRLSKIPFDRSSVPAENLAIGKPTKSGRRLGQAANPESFDSREGWPECADVIGAIHNQGRCGSCWVFGAMGSLDSRLCIHTKGEYSGPDDVLSRGYGASCVRPEDDGCQGGWPHEVLSFADLDGVVSTRCMPYFAGTDYADHWNSAMPSPECPTSCDYRYTRNIAQDLFKPRGVQMFELVDEPTSLEAMKANIYQEGPIPYAFAASQEFMAYESGVWDGSCGEQPNHAVQAIGWGVEGGKNYILSLNSWGDDWGDKGMMKVAYCIIAHYVLPGPMKDDSQIPIPIPTTVATSTSTLPPNIPDENLCPQTDDGCWTSPAYPSPYPPNSDCWIPVSIGTISVKSFFIEDSYDYFYVNDLPFTGTNGPDGVTPWTNLHFISDDSVNKDGFKICSA